MNPHPYAFLALYAAVAAAFPLALLGVARLWFIFVQPAAPGAVKHSAYECGIQSSDDSWIQFKAHYYLYAILFLLAFAAAFTALRAGALLAMLVFVLLLAEGLVWAWQRGHLEWK